MIFFGKLDFMFGEKCEHFSTGVLLKLRSNMGYSQRFRWPDYLVLTAGLLLSACIGVFYAIQRHRNFKNRVSEYLMGSRAMGVLPVAASLVVCLVIVLQRNFRLSINIDISVRIHYFLM